MLVTDKKMFMVGAPTPGMKMGQTFTADCPLPTADYPHFRDINGHG
jgi:hypothetical protein